jgi:hypothetical protein
MALAKLGSRKHSNGYVLLEGLTQTGWEATGRRHVPVMLTIIRLCEPSSELHIETSVIAAPPRMIS